VTLSSGVLTATGRVVKSGRRMSLATAEIHDGPAALVTTASSNCMISPRLSASELGSGSGRG